MSSRRSPGLVSSLACLLAGVAACTAAPSAPGAPIDDTVVERLDLRALLGTGAPHVVGVTADPLTGQEFLLDSGLGLFALGEAGASLVMPLAEWPVPDVPMRSGFTDIAALGAGRFALTAIDNGYLLDLEAGTSTQYFCYLPDDMPNREDFEQMTLSVTFDRGTDRLFAQPQTFDKQSGELVGSSVGEFSGATGQDLLWYTLPDLDFIAGGIAVQESGFILLGRGSQLYRFDRATWQLSLVAELGAWGVEEVDGLAIDASGGLLVVDAADQELVRLSASLLE